MLCSLLILYAFNAYRAFPLSLLIGTEQLSQGATEAMRRARLTREKQSRCLQFLYISDVTQYLTESQDFRVK